MKSAATILLFFFSFLTIQPLLSIASAAKQKEKCTMSCGCCHNMQKSTPKPPVKGMCGDMSCNPFGQYACCTGFIVSNKTLFSFVAEKMWKNNTLFNQTYTSSFAGDCWRPPENTMSILG